MNREERVHRTLSEANEINCRRINGSAPHGDGYFRQLAAEDRPRHARRITLICFKDEIATHGLIIRHRHESCVTAEDEKRLDWSPIDAL